MGRYFMVHLCAPPARPTSFSASSRGCRIFQGGRNGQRLLPTVVVDFPFFQPGDQLSGGQIDISPPHRPSWAFYRDTLPSLPLP